MPSTPKISKSKPADDSKKINDLETQVSELHERLARSMADYANLEKRTDSQRQMFITLTTISIISKMIDVLDDLIGK